MTSEAMTGAKEVGLAEYPFQPDAFEVRRLTADARRPSIWPRCFSPESLSRRAARTDQYPGVGSQGGPLSQGCVANAPTRGARMQGCPSM